jgi:hypothetical protein
MARQHSHYMLLYLQDPLRAERLNIGVVAWSNQDDTLYWKFIDDFSVLFALHLPPAAVQAWAVQTQVMAKMLTKETLLAEVARMEKLPYTWLGFSAKAASLRTPDVLVEEIYRLILLRYVPPQDVLPDDTAPVTNEPIVDVVLTTAELEEIMTHDNTDTNTPDIGQ